MVIFLLIKALADRGVLRLNKSLNFILYGVIILNILIFEFQIQTYFSWLIVDILGEDITLNSRTSIWDSVILQIEQSPFRGYGVGHDYQFKFRELFSSSLYVKSTHNQFLNILYESGVIGFAIFLTYTLKVIHIFQKNKVSKAYNAIAATFIIFLISMIVEISGDNVLYFTMLMIMMNFNKFNKETNYENQK